MLKKYFFEYMSNVLRDWLSSSSDFVLLPESYRFLVGFKFDYKSTLDGVLVLVNIVFELLSIVAVTLGCAENRRSRAILSLSYAR